ncbi:HD-GYP domain-containing protein [Neptunomonas antarctica]|uniref:Putative two-component system response regulator n=1 Tax=Neptunomonas antarctica TaxID=619304 RepID=A0A1N7P4L6_9GAMM|nr:HD domain-containing phosphohydrolase [Neptunomonas antarctica]SIT05562.1 putative two-component system response regulator [Neptunomonas antarctica]
MKNILIISPDKKPIKAIQDTLCDYRVTQHEHPNSSNLNQDTSLLIIDLSVLKDAGELILESTRQQIPSFLISTNQIDNIKSLACDAGLSDFLHPPFHRSIILSKIKTHINLAEIIRSYTTKSVLPDTPENDLLAAQDAAILCLASMARVRDHSTGNHILRTQHYVKALAEYLRYHPDYALELDNDETIETFYKTASLHDIGKVGIPDAILQKPGKLDPEEYEIMKKHPMFGFQAISSAERLLARDVRGKAAEFFKIAKQVTLSHHERWDGDGYPQGLKGNNIPIVARLMAVADVYDAIISKRPYKEALKHNTASAIIKSGKGTFFDPNVVDAFLELEDTFDQISYILEDYFPSHGDLSVHSFEELFP